MRVAHYDDDRNALLARPDAGERRPVPALLQRRVRELNKDPDTANFAVGNPHEFAMPSYVAGLARQPPSRRTRTGSPTS